MKRDVHGKIFNRNSTHLHKIFPFNEHERRALSCEHSFRLKPAGKNSSHQPMNFPHQITRQTDFSLLQSIDSEQKRKPKKKKIIRQLHFSSQLSISSEICVTNLIHLQSITVATAAERIGKLSRQSQLSSIILNNRNEPRFRFFSPCTTLQKLNRREVSRWHSIDHSSQRWFCVFRIPSFLPSFSSQTKLI